MEAFCIGSLSVQSRVNRFLCLVPPDFCAIGWSNFFDEKRKLVKLCQMAIRQTFQNFTKEGCFFKLVQAGPQQICISEPKKPGENVFFLISER